MKLFKIIIALLVCMTFGFSNSLTQKELYDQNFSINKGAFKIIEFDKMIRNIKVSSEEFLEIDFLENASNPLKGIKIFAKKMGNGNILITFDDATSMHININIVEDLTTAINMAKQLAPDLVIKSINGKIFLEGSVENQKIKDSILNLFKTANIELKDIIIDTSIVKNPDKMIRIKLYVVEIDNNKAEDFNNDWSITGFNDGKTSLDIRPTLNSTISLSGGLAAVANRVGSKFNTGLTLKYLQSKDIANILDETTLITLENNKSKFHSGGTINARTSTQDTIQFTQITYGLKMNIEVQEIIDGKYIKLLINTESSAIDDDIARVDDIPGIKNKTIDTNVVIGDLSTIVLGGLINIGHTNKEQKIPILGDIPILGRLFRSTQESTDNKELVFFITPEIVDVKENNQADELIKQKKSISEFTFNKQIQEKIEMVPEKNTSSSETLTQEEKFKQALGQE